MIQTPTRCVGKRCDDGPRQHDEQPQPRLTTRGLLCRRCTDRLEKNIAELPSRELHLKQAVAKAASGGDGRGTKELPLPIVPAVFDHLALMASAVTSWAMLVREERGLRGPDQSTVARLAPWLCNQVDWIVEQPWCDDLDEEIHDLSRVADTMTRRAPLRNRLEPPCPHCGARDLGRWDGAAQVDCAACGSVWDERFYPALVRLVLDTSGGCVTAAEAALELGVTVGALRNLVTRGQLRKLGTVDGLARYSTSDIEQIKNAREAS